jgi:hypothetical protein
MKLTKYCKYTVNLPCAVCTEKLCPLKKAIRSLFYDKRKNNVDYKKPA